MSKAGFYGSGIVALGELYIGALDIDRSLGSGSEDGLNNREDWFFFNVSLTMYLIKNIFILYWKLNILFKTIVHSLILTKNSFKLLKKILRKIKIY